MKSVAKYMMPDLPVEDSIGKLRGMALEGQITGGIIKNATFAMADETNEKFAKSHIQGWMFGKC